MTVQTATGPLGYHSLREALKRLTGRALQRTHC